MRFRAAQSGSRPAPPRLGCYGKLPCDAEFLRFGIDSTAGRWVVEQLDAAHDAIVAAGQRLAADRELRAFVRFQDPAGTLTALMVRPGMDTRGRAYPVAVFTALDGDDSAGAYLAPLRCAPMWPSIGRRVIENPGRSRDALELLLESAADPPDTLAAARARFDAATIAALKRPWSALTNADEAGAEALAVALTSRMGGAAPFGPFRLPDTAVNALPVVDAGLLSSIWLRLFGAQGGGTCPWAAVVELWKRGEPRWQQFYVFGRPPTGMQLASLLAGVGPGIDPPVATAASEVAGAVPSAQHTLANLRGESAACLADLWRER